MSKFFKTFMAVAAFASLTVVSSCTKTCDEGFEGDKCDTEIRTKFLGSYNTTNETCTSGGPSSFGITVSTSTNVLDVSINNIYGAGLNTKATVDADGTVSIASQSFGSGQISGSGSLSGNTLTLSYTVTGGGASDVCNNVTFTK